MQVAVILSGCGVRDGSEIHEAVSVLLCLDQAGHHVALYAPNKLQTAVIDGQTGRPMPETRNILVESQRIGRGVVKDLAKFDVSTVDAIVFPGGFGAATNLCDFGARGAQCSVDPQIESVLMQAHEQRKILGFMCIAPVIAARVFGAQGVQITIGNDKQTAMACQAMGATHVPCNATQACVDLAHRVVSVPAYMTAKSISECYESARALVQAIESLMQ